MENKEKLIGSRIKSLRKENKMSQEELASKLGIPRSYFSKIENEQRGVNQCTPLCYYLIVPYLPFTCLSSAVLM